MRWILLWFLVFAGGVSPAVFAEETLGKLELGEVLLRPAFTLQEPQQGEFSLGESSFTLSWKLDRQFSSSLSAGSLSLLNRPQIYENQPSKELGLYEAYAQWTGIFGRFRLGLIPIEFGWEGTTRESDLVFSRHLLFRKRVVALRDFGASYEISDRGFFTRCAVHNGESGENLDGRMWFTASWGWQNERNLAAGMSGQTGTTKPQATNTSTSSLANFTPTAESHWYLTQAYVHWFPHLWDFVMEAGLGELDQKVNVKKVQFYSGHADLSYRFGDHWTLHGRYDHFDPQGQIKGDMLREYSLGASVFNQHQTSTLILMVTKVVEEKNKVNNDEFRLVWRLTPQFH